MPVYRVLNCHELFLRRGELSLSDLDTLLTAVQGFHYPPERQLFLIEMMRRFELCFQFEGHRGTEISVAWHASVGSSGHG